MAVSLILIGIIAWICFDAIPPGATDYKVLLIGIDGASWNLMDPLLSEGKLPNFQRLMDSGSYGDLRTLTPAWSPLLWTSMATGKLPAKHGIQATLSPETGKIIPAGGKRITKAFWNIVSDSGLSVGLVNWWVTWPAEKVNGFVVSDRYRRSQLETNQGLTYPPDLIRKLPKAGVTELGFEYEIRLFGLPPNVIRAKDEGINYKIYWGQDKAVRDSTRLLLAERKVEVFAVVFRIVDISSHLYWSLVEGSANDDRTYSKALEPVYVYADQILGDILSHAGSRTNIIVCSDHGFEKMGEKYDHNGAQEPPAGVVILNGPAFRRDHRIRDASILDITPTLLYLLQLPLGRDMDGSPIFKAFHPDFVRAHRPRVIASHDRGTPGKDAPSNEMDEQQAEDFRALGYIQ